MWLTLGLDNAARLTIPLLSANKLPHCWLFDYTSGVNSHQHLIATDHQMLSVVDVVGCCCNFFLPHFFFFFFFTRRLRLHFENTCTKIIIRTATRTQLSININCFLKYTHEQNVLHATCSTGMDTPLRSPSDKKVVSIMNMQWSFQATSISETDILTSLTS